MKAQVRHPDFVGEKTMLSSNNLHPPGMNESKLTQINPSEIPSFLAGILLRPAIWIGALVNQK